ncbi:hypothetical protein AB0M54_47530 [Actinoplanes sp. NPDC051470]|uniref:hypothetical protein n=1 Tax=Actinoplanes sp. NPDC051470 TaxID=3157224 RepID=UPI003431E990
MARKKTCAARNGGDRAGREHQRRPAPARVPRHLVDVDDLAPAGAADRRGDRAERVDVLAQPWRERLAPLHQAQRAGGEADGEGPHQQREQESHEQTGEGHRLAEREEHYRSELAAISSRASWR